MPDTDVALSLRMPKRLHQQLKVRARLEDRTISAVARKAIAEYLKEESK